MFSNQAGFLQSLGWAVLNSLWQLALLWVIYQLITSVFSKNIKSANKSWLASAFLVAGFAWFIFTFLTVYSSAGADAGIGAAFITSQGNTEVNNWLNKSLPVASLLYLALLIFPILHFVRNYRYVQAIRTYGLSKIDVDWKLFIRSVAARMGITRKVNIWVSEFVTSPVTVGFLKPVILVPLAAINHLTPQQLEAVLLHELSHIRRHDYFVNLVLNFIQTILYFNPFVKAFVKIVEREREKSCDEMVLQFQYDSHEYASALLTLEKANHVPKVLTLASGGHRNDLLHRVETIMGVGQKPVFSFNKLAGLVAGLLCIIGLNSLIILSKPANNKGSNYAYLSAPFDFIVGGYESDKANTTPVTINGTETVRQPVVNNLEPVQKDLETEETPAEDQGPIELPTPDDYKTIASALKQVSFEHIITPELKKYQEEQVKEALDASRKVLENAQWKALEKNIADVFTEQEKEELRTSYRKEVNKFDWKKWENKLKQAYEKVDWDNVNYQLSNAVNQIRLDSLQHVYNDVAVKLSEVQHQLTLSGLEGIPDSDVTLAEVEKKRQQAQRVLTNLKTMRNKKIVHL